MGNYKLNLTTCLLCQVNSSQLLSKEQRLLIKSNMRGMMEEQIKCWAGTQEVCMQCPSCQRFPMCSEAVSLCIHATNPVFNRTKVGFPFCLVPPNCSHLGRSGSHSKHLFSAYSSRTLILLSYQNDRILLFEDTNNSMRKKVLHSVQNTHSINRKKLVKR